MEVQGSCHAVLSPVCLRHPEQLQEPLGQPFLDKHDRGECYSAKHLIIIDEWNQHGKLNK